MGTMNNILLRFFDNFFIVCIDEILLYKKTEEEKEVPFEGCV
jgi:hypothetical protein